MGNRNARAEAVRVTMGRMAASTERVTPGAPDDPVRGGPIAFDIALTVVILAYNAVVQGFAGPWYEYCVPLGLCLPWLARRRWPLPVLVTMLAFAVLQTLLGLGVLPADLMLALGVHNLAARSRWQCSIPFTALVVGWIGASWAPRMNELYLNPGDLGVFMLLVVVAWVSGMLVRIRRQQIATLEGRARQLEREKQTQRRAIVVAERTRIARELHDIVSHSLSSVVLLADGAAETVREDPERARHAMHLVRDSARGALGETRNILDLLRDEDSVDSATRSPQPGIADLPALVAEFDAAGPAARLDVRGEARELSAGLELAVHRIVQESLTNARKHGGPALTSVEVEVCFPPASGDDGTLQVRICDDGAGGDASADGGGHGLVGMRERVAALDGTLTAGPRRDGGFDVLVRLPMTLRSGSGREGRR